MTSRSRLLSYCGASGVSVIASCKARRIACQWQSSVCVLTLLGSMHLSYWSFGREGLDAYATYVGVDGLTRYAYEVDGRGGQLTGFDDANMPSLLGLPLLGYRHYNRKVYANTRAFILSEKNQYFFSGEPVLAQ